MQLPGLQLYLAPTQTQRLALAQLLSDQRTPGNPEYQKWLTPAQFGAVFGVSAADEARLRLWLNSQGFTDVAMSNSRTVMTFAGNAEQASHAFHAEIHRLKQNGEKHFANVSEIAIPESLSAVIQSVRGLNDFNPHAVHNYSGVTPQYTNVQGHHGLAPGDIATIYDIQSVYQSGISGSGITIAIVGDATLDLSDIAAYRTAYNLPMTLPTVVNVPGGAGTNSSDLIEADMDLELAGAVAPNATLIYLNSGSVYAALQYAVDQNLAQVVSMSFGGCEADNSGFAIAEELVAEQANAQGITLLASSGDSGAAACDPGFPVSATKGLAVDFPASVPGFTGVGGTSFNASVGNYFGTTNNSEGGSVLSYIPEVAWDTQFGWIEASGGGASTLYSKPSWQQGLGVPSDGHRDVPDVAFFAGSNEFGYIVCSAGDCAAGAPDLNMGAAFATGTSAATPVFAGIVALLNNWLVTKGELQKPGLGNINPHLYSLAAAASNAFHDVTQGNNIVPCQANTVGCIIGSYGYSAGPGYDQVTGLGSVDVYNLLRQWSSATIVSTTLALSTSNPAIGQGNSVTFTATVTAASGTASPTGTITFYANNTVLGSATLNQSGVAAFTVSTLLPGLNAVQAAYAGNGSFGESISGLTENVLATTTTLVSGWNQVVQGVTVPLVASIVQSSGVTIGTGTVTFYNGTTQLCTLPVSGGMASCAPTNLPVGIDSLTASYSGTSTLGPSTSAPISVTITPITPVGTTTTLTVSPTKATMGTTLTLTALVRPVTGQIAATGTVTFYSGTMALGTVTLSNGTGSTTVSTLPVGTASITASYTGSSGSSNLAASTSTAVPVTITTLNTATTLTATPTQASLGTTITLTISVQPATGTTIPTGTVTFYNGSTSLGMATLANGVATITTSTLPVGSDSLTASYSGSSNYLASTSTSVPVTIAPIIPPDFAIVASASTLTVTGGQNATTTLTVTPSNGFNQPLALSCAGQPSGSSCTFGTAALQANGTSTISLSINTQKLTASSTQYRSPNAPLFAILPCALFFLKRRKAFANALQLAAVVLIFAAIAVGLTGCGVGPNQATSQPASQTSTVTVTAQAQGGASHTLALTLTVD
jgi:hypothetical protein